MTLFQRMRRPVAMQLSCLALALGSAWGCGDSDDESGLSGWYDDGETGDQDDYTPGLEPPMTGTNVSFGGSQDIGFMRGQLEAGRVPSLDSLDDAGFFAEHFIELPAPSCGQRVCVQPMVAVMGSLFDTEPVTMLHLGLKSPIVADPSARPPLDLSVVVDVSGSMMGDKIEQVKQGLELLVDSMRDSDRIALVIYSDNASVESELSPVVDKRIELRRAIDSLIANGGTNIYAGLELGYGQLLTRFDEEAQGRERRVILLSDGVPTQGRTDTPGILQLSRGFNSEGIGISTIGLGADFNIELMRGLSQQGDGNFYFVEDASAVDEVFEEELSFFLVPVALDLTLEVTAGESYTLAQAYGAPLWQDTAAGGKVEIPSVFLAHRESDEDVTDQGDRRGGGGSLIARLLPRADAGDPENATIATVELRFRDPATSELVSDRVELRYPGPLRSVLNQGYWKAGNLAAAHKSFVMLNVYLGMERAITEFHARTADRQTIAELDALIAAVEDYNQEIKDVDIELDLELLDMLRDNLVSSGVSASRADLRDDPWPCD